MRICFFIVLTGISIVLYFPWFKETALLAHHSDNFSYIQLIPFISLFFFIYSGKKIFTNIRYDLIGGGIITASAIAGYWIIRTLMPSFFQVNDLLCIVMVSWLLLFTGIFTATFGLGSLRYALFPILMLVFLAPIPDYPLELVINFLKRGSAETANILFRLTGTEFIRAGDTFHLQELSIEVAPQCSGIHSSISLLITAIIAANIFLKRKISMFILYLSVIPITIFKNAVRIVTLTLLGAHVNPAILSSSLHKQGGKPFFILAFLLLLIVLSILKKGERNLKKV